MALIILTAERWKHITDRHPELTNSRSQIIEAVADPDELYMDIDSMMHAIKRIRERYLVVIYAKMEEDELIRTAYYTNLKRKERRYKRFTKLKPY